MKITVGVGKHRVVPRARAQQRRVPVGHIRQFGDAQRVSDRRADEIQERVQVQNHLRRAADRHGAVAGLRERRMGSDESDATVRPHTHIASGVYSLIVITDDAVPRFYRIHVRQCIKPD